MKVKQLLVFAMTALSAALVFAATDREQEIRDRLMPIGKVCMSGDSCAAPPIAVSTGPRTPEDIYNTTCTVCHATGVTESPILGNKEQWAPRIAQGIETLYTHALTGFNAMPAKGTCMNCSDDEIKATVDYMVEKSK